MKTKKKTKHKIDIFNPSGEILFTSHGEAFRIQYNGFKWLCTKKEPEYRCKGYDLHVVQSEGKMHVEVIYKEHGRRKHARLRHTYDPRGFLLLRPLGSDFALCYVDANGNHGQWSYHRKYDRYWKDQIKWISDIPEAVRDIRYLGHKGVMVIYYGTDLVEVWRLKKGGRFEICTDNEQVTLSGLKPLKLRLVRNEDFISAYPNLIWQNADKVFMNFSEFFRNNR